MRQNMKKTTKATKLTVNKESLRKLQESSLGRVAGGGRASDNPFGSCKSDCWCTRSRFPNPCD
jgi:hypothetical protein